MALERLFAREEAVSLPSRGAHLWASLPLQSMGLRSIPPPATPGDVGAGACCSMLQSEPCPGLTSLLPLPSLCGSSQQLRVTPGRQAAQTCCHIPLSQACCGMHLLCSTEKAQASQICAFQSFSPAPSEHLASPLAADFILAVSTQHTLQPADSGKQPAMCSSKDLEKGSLPRKGSSQ